MAKIESRGREIDRQIDKHTDRRRKRERVRQTDRQSDTEGERPRQKDRKGESEKGINFRKRYIERDIVKDSGRDKDLNEQSITMMWGQILCQERTNLSLNMIWFYNVPSI